MKLIDVASSIKSIAAADFQHLGIACGSEIAPLEQDGAALDRDQRGGQ
jgi:hypothetical protein